MKLSSINYRGPKPFLNATTTLHKRFRHMDHVLKRAFPDKILVASELAGACADNRGFYSRVACSVLGWSECQSRNLSFCLGKPYLWELSDLSSTLQESAYKPQRN